MKKLFKKIRRCYTFFRDMDWEYIVPCLFAHLKYKDPIQRRKAMQSVKQAFFERRFSHILEKYKSAVSPEQENTGPIWVCWLQGEENMPPIVKRCYEQLKLMAPEGREVVLLHMGNIGKYVRIPDYIYDKLHKGIMTYTHFSDILRFALLAENGGMWVDSTLFVSKPIPEELFQQMYYTAKTEYDSSYTGINRCLWKCFLLGAVPHSPWFSCAKEIIYDYWDKVNYFVDYLVVDYILLLIYDHNRGVKEGVDVGAENAPHILGFEKIANEPYDVETYRKMCEECRWFKLSYKISFREYTDDGRLTYFGYLMSTK